MEKKLGEQIKFYMELKNLTQKDVAKKVGVSQNSISRWVNDICQPDATNIYKLCELFECNLDDLFEVDQTLQSSDTMFFKVLKEISVNSNNEKELNFEEKNCIPILKIELKSMSLNKDNIFAYRISDNSMKPWYIKDDIVICIKSDFPMPDRDNLVIYDSDNKAKLRYTYFEKDQPWVELSNYNYITHDHNINKMTTRIENAKHCLFFGYVIKIIRNTNTESFLINR